MTWRGKAATEFETAKNAKNAKVERDLRARFERARRSRSTKNLPGKQEKDG
jgi:hypothetical protein